MTNTSSIKFMYVFQWQSHSFVVCERHSTATAKKGRKKIKFSIKDFCNKCDQIRWKLRIWLKKSLMENFKTSCLLVLNRQFIQFSDYVKSQTQSRISGEPLPLISASCDQIRFDLLHKKPNFSLGISSVNVTKSAVSCRFGHIYWGNT